MKILIVEDDAITRTALRMRCEKAGHEVLREISSEDEAIIVLKELSPDMVFLDQNLDSGLGTNVLKSVYRLLPNTTFVIITGDPEITIQEKLYDTLDVHYQYLGKPFLYSSRSPFRPNLSNLLGESEQSLFNL